MKKNKRQRRISLVFFFFFSEWKIRVTGGSRSGCEGRARAFPCILTAADIIHAGEADVMERSVQKYTRARAVT